MVPLYEYVRYEVRLLLCRQEVLQNLKAKLFFTVFCLTSIQLYRLLDNVHVQGFEPSVAAIIGQHSTPAHPQMPVDFFTVNFHSKSVTLLSKLISTCCSNKIEARETIFKRL